MIGPRSLSGSTPVPGRGANPAPRGTTVTDRGCPQPGQDRGTPRQDWSTPRTGYPWTGYTVGAKPLAPPARTGLGFLPSKDWGTPLAHVTLGQVTPLAIRLLPLVLLVGYSEYSASLFNRNVER